MSTLEVGILVLGAVLVVGMIGEYGPRWLAGVRDLEAARLGRHGALYPTGTVHCAIRGALIAQNDLDDEEADRIADLIVDELEHNDSVFDGHEWHRLNVYHR